MDKKLKLIFYKNKESRVSLNARFAGEDQGYEEEHL